MWIARWPGPPVPSTSRLLSFEQGNRTTEVRSVAWPPIHTAHKQTVTTGSLLASSLIEFAEACGRLACCCPYAA